MADDSFPRRDAGTASARYALTRDGRRSQIQIGLALGSDRRLALTLRLSQAVDAHRALGAAIEDAKAALGRSDLYGTPDGQS